MQTASPTGSIVSSKAISRPTVIPRPLTSDSTSPPTSVCPRRSSRRVDEPPARVGTDRRLGRAGSADLPPADRVGDLRLADTPDRASRLHRVLARGHHRDHDERRPPQPAVVEPRPRVRRHHADGRRLRRPRLGSGVPPRPPAPRMAAQRMEHGLVRGHAHLPLLHGRPGPARRRRRHRAPVRHRPEARRRAPG